MRTVLIVEDNPSHLRLAKLLLSRAGYAVLAAESGPEGLSAARTHLPDLILMDIQLPGMDGLAVTRELQREPATLGIRVIAVSSYLGEHSESEIKAAGCTAWIAKPYHHAELLTAVKRALGEEAAPPA